MSAVRVLLYSIALEKIRNNYKYLKMERQM